jgi:T5SS/PEP-CTERM-associated repeat protein
VTVNGTGSKITTGNTFIGSRGNGTLNIQAGGELVTNQGAFIAEGRGSVGTATVTGNGSKWTISQDLSIDGGGDGTLNILNGGAVSNKNAYLSTNIDRKATVTVDGASST